MALKWIGEHWLEAITAIGILYGIVMSTYNFIAHRKLSERRLDVRVAYGEFRNAPAGISDHPMLFIDVANIGYFTVTVDAPYFILADGRTYSPPERLSKVDYPHELNTCKRFSLAAREADIRRFYGTSCGYKGEVFLYGAVKDQTGKVWISKKPWRLGLRDGKQKKRSIKLEWEAIRKCQGIFRDYSNYSSFQVWTL